jgi:hypothetical protein
MGANPQQTLQAFREAEAYSGPSLILAYSHCIAHGFDLRFGMKQQDLATASGYWPLFRYDPAMRNIGENPFRLDSPRPAIPFKDYANNELRYRALAQTQPAVAEELLRRAQADVVEKYRNYEALAVRCEPTAEADPTIADDRLNVCVRRRATASQRIGSPSVGELSPEARSAAYANLYQCGLRRRCNDCEQRDSRR